MQYFPALGGPLAGIAQWCFLESLPQGELRTGAHLREVIRDTATAHNLEIRTTFQSVASVDELIGAMAQLQAETQVSRLGTLLHIDCHGNDEGLGLADGSFIRWQELAPRFAELNLACAFNLFLALACCEGAYFLETSDLGVRSAFCALLSPPQTIDAGPLETGFTAFYRGVLTGQDVNAALTAATAAVNGNFPYYFTSAEGLFRNIFERYIRSETLQARAERLIEAQRAAGETNLPSVEDMMRASVLAEQNYFAQSRQIFFALDLIPGNAARYPLGYLDVVPAEHRAARGL
jgi:hypothetical protein